MEAAVVRVDVREVARYCVRKKLASALVFAYDIVNIEFWKDVVDGVGCFAYSSVCSVSFVGESDFVVRALAEHDSFALREPGKHSVSLCIDVWPEEVIDVDSIVLR